VARKRQDSFLNKPLFDLTLQFLRLPFRQLPNPISLWREAHSLAVNFVSSVHLWRECAWSRFAVSHFLWIFLFDSGLYTPHHHLHNFTEKRRPAKTIGHCFLDYPSILQDLLRKFHNLPNAEPQEGEAVRWSEQIQSTERTFGPTGHVENVAARREVSQ